MNELKNYTVMIAEKPSVGRDYARYLHIDEKHDGYICGYSDVLDKNMVVTWAVGHLVKLSYPEEYDEKYKTWDINDLPFMPSKYKYEIIPDVAKQFKIIKSLYANAEAILYAGDSAREGLYLQALIRQEAKVPKGIDERIVWLNSITEKEVLRGIKEAKPYEEYKERIAAGYARAIEDYSTGINFSRALTCKFGREFNKRIDSGKRVSISVGRVMSTVLGMVVEREREIRNFKEQSFYKIVATSSFEATWHVTERSMYYNSPFLYNEEGFKEEDTAEVLRSTCEKNPTLTIKEVSVKEEKKGAPLLFNLAELQLFCSNKYKLSPDKTLSILQTLYEAKFITYPRTDSRYLSSAIADEIKYNLNGLSHGDYKKEFIEEIAKNKWHHKLKSSVYVNDEKVADHYAIIPTGKYNEMDSLKELEKKVLYDIIDRFLCVFYPVCVYEKGQILLENKTTNEEFKGSNKTVKSMGWTVVLDEHEEPSENVFHSLNVGDEVFANYSIKEGKTAKPKRYSTGTMIIAMENAGKLIEDEELRAQIIGSGIGTSATRAAILKKLIVEKEYLSCNPKTQILTPTIAGESCVEILEQTIPSLLEPEMTASWEKGLSKMEQGEVPYSTFMQKLTNYVDSEVDKVKGFDEDGILFSNGEATPVVLKCPFCLNEIKENSKAFSCQGYKDKSCDFTIWKTIAGKKISRANVIKLLRDGTTNKICGFMKKDGTTFDAYLTLDSAAKSVTFAFPARKTQKKD